VHSFRYVACVRSTCCHTQYSSVEIPGPENKTNSNIITILIHHVSKSVIYLSRVCKERTSFCIPLINEELGRKDINTIKIIIKLINDLEVCLKTECRSCRISIDRWVKIEAVPRKYVTVLILVTRVGKEGYP
jgi:hypothetical protein